MTQPDDPLVDFRPLVRRLRRVSVTVGALAATGAVVDLVRSTVAEGGFHVVGPVMARWLLLLVGGLVVAFVVVSAVHAVRGVDAATRRGERLSSQDVGLLPPRRRRGT